MSQKILVTGAAGFVGAHVAAELARAGHRVTGVDNYNAYYEPRLKHDRVAALLGPLGVPCQVLDLCDAAATRALLADGGFDAVIHLAAQAGVRHSIKAPGDYIQSNLVGFGNVLEACREAGVPHLLYASSSSVYGSRADAPFRETDRVDRPASLYAATKIANELMAHTYASIHGLRSTGLRFFTVYGPWGRPDMAYFSFSRRIRAGQPITLFAEGQLLRDFTYIDDIVDAVIGLLHAPATVDKPTESDIYNLGHHVPVKVVDFVRTLEDALGLKAQIEFGPMQAGDVPVTCADDGRLRARIGDWACTSLADGLGRFARWIEAWEPAPGA
ncbi:NAD-dependent epimerase/dehydratase family protein [Ideonella sp. DXS29W]|uniref:NAD-dependent epimerase/dehydratase family protein n=1 Tax=Ideonella lacteola TaxID=2984193 RepID=A0ABU9BVU0_9BURK